MSNPTESAHRYYAEGWWRDTTPVADLAEAALSRPGEISSVTYSDDGGWVESLTVGDLDSAVNDLAKGLLSKGVGAGDVVCFQLPNWWHFNAVLLACARIGAIACPIHIILRRREVEFILRSVRASTYFVPEQFRGFDFVALADSLSREIEGLRNIIVAKGPRGSEDSFHDLLAEGEEYSGDVGRPGTANGLATIQFTSGTTGQPKGVMHTHNTLFAAARLMHSSLELGASDVIMMPSPLSHATGLVYGCLMPTVFGMPVVYQDTWDAARFVDISNAHHGTWSAGSTPFVLDTIRHCKERGSVLPDLRFFVCSGATIPRYLADELKSVTGSEMVTVWGLTETSGATITDAGHLDRARDSDGSASPAMQVCIVDDDGQPVPPGVIGRLLVRGASEFVGYFERDDLTRDAVDDAGWLDSGDMATIDAYGFIAVKGRKKDIVIRGGENIPVVEVEEALLRHESIRDVAVVGVADERLGERACAVVVAEPDANLDLGVITGFLDEAGFAKQYWPERLELVDSLPRTGSGKVQKYLLRQALSDR